MALAAKRTQAKSSEQRLWETADALRGNADLEQADAPIVASLGEEALQTLCRIPQLAAVPPAQSLTELYGDRYGEEGTLRVNGRAVRWLPLVHPGLLKGDRPSPDDPADPSARTVRGFNVSHARWERDVVARR